MNSASKARAIIAQTSTETSQKTMRALEGETAKAKQKIQEEISQSTQESVKVTISKGRPAAAAPQFKGMSPALQEYMRIQNS
ncbi:MAG: hypothetical protein HQL51_15975 [Magnetococcales bacterium]|nr:hypothetical protein [Magnetococcales bacterium]